MPANADYIIGSYPCSTFSAGALIQNATMDITGSLKMGYGSVEGTGTIFLKTTDAFWEGSTLKGNLYVSNGATLTIGSEGNASCNLLGNILGGNLVNEGVINVITSGGIGHGIGSSFINNNLISIEADSFILGDFYNSSIIGFSSFINDGIINVDASATAFGIGLTLTNNSNINLLGSTNYYSGSLNQNANITGNGGIFTSYGPDINFNAGGSTTGFENISIIFALNAVTNAGTNLGNPSQFYVLYSNDVVLNKLPASADVTFYNALVTLNVPLIVNGQFSSTDANVSGTGNVVVNGQFDWINGRYGVPILINASGTVKISTNEVSLDYMPHPTIGAAFTNNGTLTWLGGKIISRNNYH
ncbi:MAG: hypothetical protein IPO92_18730 [Saprospiraceae bacterium]|nr:hypothetical protein [Saprospiraceae bacterium]